MERKSKSELLKHIEEQDKALGIYQRRLHDVVESYKNLTKEKEALQESVKLLTKGSRSVDVTEESKNESDTERSEKEKRGSSNEDSVDTFEALKTTLRVLTTEKSRIECEMKADRRRLLKENEELKAKLESQEMLLSNERLKFENSVKELRKQIRDQQKEREKEQQDHAVMLKELQSLVADERCAKEKFEQQLENLKFALEKLPDKRFEYEKRINELQNELSKMKELLQEAEGEKKDLPSLLRQLQQEMCEMKERHQEAVEREYKRANEAEEKLKALATLSEERAASLEQRLCELSQMVGSYDKLRQQDQIAIQKLKERVAQLDQENIALANTVAGTDKTNNFDIDSNLDDQVLMDRISKLKGLLHLAMQRSKKSLKLKGILADIQKDEELFNPHAACHKESEHLKAELEQYKLKLQTARDLNSMEVESQCEATVLKQQVKKLEEELETTKIQMKGIEEHNQQILRKLEKTVSDLKLNHSRELSVFHAEYKTKLLELEQQGQKQRERSMAILEDKEKEIEQLNLSLKLKEKQLKKLTGTKEKQDRNLTELLSTSVSSSSKGKTLLHYTQEISRKEVEISNLRKCRSQAETALRELQQNTLIKEEYYQNEIDDLKSRIKRLESPEKGVNMEYLKNVILRFIKSNDTNDQSHMINAIGAILHFTPQEIQDIKFSRQSWTWNV